MELILELKLIYIKRSQRFRSSTALAAFQGLRSHERWLTRQRRAKPCVCCAAETLDSVAFLQGFWCSCSGKLFRCKFCLACSGPLSHLGSALLPSAGTLVCTGVVQASAGSMDGACPQGTGLLLRLSPASDSLRIFNGCGCFGLSLMVLPARKTLGFFGGVVRHFVLGTDCALLLGTKPSRTGNSLHTCPFC